MIFELAISLRAVVVRLADAPPLQPAPPYTQFGPPAQVGGPFPALRPLNFPDLSRLVPLYMGWGIRKASPSDFPPDSKFALSHPPSWTRIVCKPMPFSSDELFLKVLAQISRRARKDCTLQDEYNGLRLRSQKRQVDRLIKDKNEELPKGLEWRLAGLESVVRIMGLWRKETRLIKVILKTQWVPGVGGERGDGGAGLGGVGGGIRLGGRNDGGGTSGLDGAGRAPPPPGPREPHGGGGARFYPQQYPERPQGDGGESAPFGAYQDGQDFRARERDNVRTQSRRSHSRRHQYSPPTPAPVPHGPHGMRLPHRRGLIIEDPSSLPPPPPEHGYGHRPPPNIHIPASQGYNYMPPRSPSPPPPPPPMYMHTPYLAPPSVPQFESHESALRTVRSEVTPQQEELVVDSLLAEWEPPKRDRKGKRREDRRSSLRNTSYGRDWALGLDIPRRDSYPGREYRPESTYRREPTYRPEPSYYYGPSHPSRSVFHSKPNFSSGSGLYSGRGGYRRRYYSDPGSGSGYSSQSDNEVGRPRRQRMQSYRRDSTDLAVEPRAGVSYGGRGRYADTRSPRYEERYIDERLRHGRRSSDAESIDDEADSYIEVRREGGVQRSGDDIFSEERPRRMSDRNIVLRREPSRSRRGRTRPQASSEVQRDGRWGDERD
jgi:hypothetical protein